MFYLISAFRIRSYLWWYDLIESNTVEHLKMERKRESELGSYIYTLKTKCVSCLLVNNPWNIHKSYSRILHLNSIQFMCHPFWEWNVLNSSFIRHPFKWNNTIFIYIYWQPKERMNYKQMTFVLDCLKQFCYFVLTQSNDIVVKM